MARLEIRNLSKSYYKDAVPALKDFSYDFDDGVYGLLGPNGAGKSTLMNMIVGNLYQDSGSVHFKGTDIESLGRDYRNIIGFMPQQQQLYENFTVQRFLFYFAALKGIPKVQAREKIEELLQLVGLYEVSGRRLKNLSGGMKQRVLLAEALLNDPEILILDEPTAGLDPKERMNIRNYIYSIAKGKTILIATHVISDIEQIAKETIFLRKGEIVLSGTPEQAVKEVGKNIWEAEAAREEYGELNRAYPLNRVIGERDGKVMVKIIAEEAPKIPGICQAAVSLEDVYMYLYP